MRPGILSYPISIRKGSAPVRSLASTCWSQDRIYLGEIRLPSPLGR